MRATELSRLAEELGIDVVGAAPVSAYDQTESHIRERRARGLFADMRFTMARPEESCHPETLLDGARTVVSAGYCYWAEGPEPGAGEGFYGKNTMLITRRHGSWVVLGTLVTDVDIETTPPLGLDCGSCRLCVD